MRFNPFEHFDPKDEKFTQGLMNDIHQNFIQVVRNERVRNIISPISFSPQYFFSVDMFFFFFFFFVVPRTIFDISLFLFFFFFFFFFLF